MRAPDGRAMPEIIGVNNRGATLGIGPTARATVAETLSAMVRLERSYLGRPHEPWLNSSWRQRNARVYAYGRGARRLCFRKPFPEHWRMTISGYVSGTNTVRVTLANNTAGAL